MAMSRSEGVQRMGNLTSVTDRVTLRHGIDDQNIFP